MKNSITWVGMDDSANKINVAVFQNQEDTLREEFEVATDDRGLGKLIKKLKGLPGTVRCVYEAGPCGYYLQRQLKQKGIACDVVAPSLTPRRAGQRVKTNKRDARKLAKLHRAGELTSILIPSEKQEALRDLLRAREDVGGDVTRFRNRLNGLLLRNGLKYRAGKRWTLAHRKWLKSLELKEPLRQMVLEEYRTTLAEGEERLKDYDEKVTQTATDPDFARVASYLMALRGVRVITAMTIIAEGMDLRRFASAPQFMSWTGIIPSENSTGDKERRGHITKTGNAHVRRVLIESGWHYRHPPTESKALKQRRKELPREVVEIAKKADKRLNKKFWRLMTRGKRSTTAVVAVSRELAGFVWAIGQVA